MHAYFYSIITLFHFISQNRLVTCSWPWKQQMLINYKDTVSLQNIIYAWMARGDLLSTTNRLFEIRDKFSISDSFFFPNIYFWPFSSFIRQIQRRLTGKQRERHVAEGLRVDWNQGWPRSAMQHMVACSPDWAKSARCTSEFSRSDY